jgi:WD40 repeat protein
MFLGRFSWLDIAEYISLFFTFIGLIIFLVSGKLFSWIFFLFISLILSSINRFRLEIRTRSRIAAALKIQLRKFSKELHEIEAKFNYSFPEAPNLKSPQLSLNHLQPSDNIIIASLQQDLENLDQSITSIVNYINKYMFHKKIEILAKKYETISQKIEQFTQEDNISKEVNVLDENLLLNKPQSNSLEPTFNINWECLYIIPAHSQSVTGLAISDDRQLLVSVSWDQTLKLWSLEEGNLIDSVVASDQGLLVVSINKFSLSNPNSCQYCMATGSFDQKIKIWSLTRDKKDNLMISLAHTITGHTGSIHGLAIADGDNILVSGSYDQTVKQWDLETGKLLESSYDESGSIYAIAIHQQGKFIASGGGDGSIKIWALGTGEMLCLLTGNIISVESVALSSSGEIIAAGCVDGTIKLWYLKEDLFTSSLEVNPSLVILAHQGQVMSLVFSRDGQILYSSAVDGLIKIWHVQTGKELGHLTISEENRVFSLALSSDGKLLAAGSMDGKIKIWQQNQ